MNTRKDVRAESGTTRVDPERDLTGTANTIGTATGRERKGENVMEIVIALTETAVRVDTVIASVKTGIIEIEGESVRMEWMKF